MNEFHASKKIVEKYFNATKHVSLKIIVNEEHFIGNYLKEVTVKKAEHQRIDAFELWCWRRLLRVPWTARRSNQSILKEISPGISLDKGSASKLQYLTQQHL